MERTIKHGNVTIVITNSGVANPNHKWVCDVGGASFTRDNEVDILHEMKKNMTACIKTIENIIESMKGEA